MVLVVVVVVLVDAFSGAVPGADVACYHTLTLQKTQDSGGEGEGKIPSREEVMMQSSWNPSQEIGSDPTILD